MKYFLQLLFIIQFSSCENNYKKTAIVEEDIYTLEKVIKDVAPDLIKAENVIAQRETNKTDFSNNILIYSDSTILPDGKFEHYIGSDHSCFDNTNITDTFQQNSVIKNLLKQSGKSLIDLKDTNIKFIKLSSIFKSDRDNYWENYNYFKKNKLYDSLKVRNIFYFSDVAFSQNRKYAMVFYLNYCSLYFIAELKEKKWIFVKRGGIAC